MTALRELGIDARMVVARKEGDSHKIDSLSIDEAAPHWKLKASFLAECGEIFLRNGFNRSDLFKVSTATFGVDIADHPWVKDADVVVLNWVNQGMMSLDGVRRICAQKPVVWTMHDMWNATGVCHHAAECRRWTSGNSCGRCPLLGARCNNDLSRSVFKRKKKLYDATDIHFVAVSTWLAEKCRESALMADSPLSVIPNAFPVEQFHPTPMRSDLVLRHMPLSPRDNHYDLTGLTNISGRFIVMGAARLDDPIKNLPLAIEALNRVTHPDAVAVFYGDIRNPEILRDLKMRHIHIGSISSSALPMLMGRASVVLSTSRYETLPGTIIEGMGAGAVPVATGHGGQRDIIDHGINGYIADVDDPELIASYIDRALLEPFEPIAQHLSVLHKFSAASVANKYIELFNKLVK
jgi:glycosyltransferase involved in cell wall biosynthesis